MTKEKWMIPDGYPNQIPDEEVRVDPLVSGKTKLKPLSEEVEQELKEFSEDIERAFERSKNSVEKCKLRF